MGKLHFGYKRHTVTDENGLVLAEETTAANKSDMKHLEIPLKKAKLPRKALVYADKGYDSMENKETLKRMKLKCRIMHKGTRGHEITERQQRINVARSKIRYKVERSFGSMHRWFGAGIARYVGLSKTHAQHIMESIAYNLYRTPGIIVSNSIRRHENTPIKDCYLLKNNLQRHLLIKNIYSFKSVWVRIERMVGFAEVSVYGCKENSDLCRIVAYLQEK